MIILRDVRSGREVCEGAVGYVMQYKDSGIECILNDRRLMKLMVKDEVK